MEYLGYSIKKNVTDVVSIFTCLNEKVRIRILVLLSAVESLDLSQDFLRDCPTDSMFSVGAVGGSRRKKRCRQEKGHWFCCWTNRLGEDNR